jgi:pimeloyl-ACP methyl ester carboxylesterase
MPLPGPRFPASPRRFGLQPGRLLAVGLASAILIAPRPAECQAPQPVAPQPVAPQPVAPQPAAPQPAAPEQLPGPERLLLPTSDGVQLAAWYYPVPKGDDAAAPDKPAVAMLVHDLDGSHASVEPLARALQQQRIAVVAPDLRGHGESVTRVPAAGAAEKVEARLLKKPDLEAMSRTGGGRVREQAAVRGDLEAVRGWIKKQSEAGSLDFDRLFIVGSGLGAAVAMTWAVEDARWPAIATGPQGRQVRGIVLVSPTWTTRGFSIAPVLADDLIRRSLPLLVIAGTEDRDGVKLYDQLKRQRPTEWYEKRADQPATQPAGRGEQGATAATLFLFQLNTPRERDALASWIETTGRGIDPAGLIAGFITTVGQKAAK